MRIRVSIAAKYEEVEWALQRRRVQLMLRLDQVALVVTCLQMKFQKFRLGCKGGQYGDSHFCVRQRNDFLPVQAWLHAMRPMCRAEAARHRFNASPEIGEGAAHIGDKWGRQCFSAIASAWLD
jgi:hypothetical protein